MIPEKALNERWTLPLSRGWIWHMQVTGADGEIAHIEQTDPKGQLAGNGIDVPVIDLPWVARWLRGSYSADEWPEERQLSNETLLLMEPRPKPELWIEQWTTLGRHGRSAAPQAPIGRLMLFEEDLRPLVEWLHQRCSVFGVDLRNTPPPP